MNIENFIKMRYIVTDFMDFFTVFVWQGENLSLDNLVLQCTQTSLIHPNPGRCEVKLMRH